MSFPANRATLPPSHETHPLEFEKPIVELEKAIAALKVRAQEHAAGAIPELEALQAKLAETRRQIYSNLNPWQRVQIVRHPARPYTLDYLKLIATDFMEMSGDRCFGNDQALIGGFATIGEQKVMVVGHQKGHDTKENIKHNFGLAHPEGYRKALRLMKIADKFGLPIVSFHRHARRVSRHRVGGAAYRGGDRGEPARDVYV